MSDAVGRDTDTFDELVRLVARAVGRRTRLVHLPAGVVSGFLKRLGSTNTPPTSAGSTPPNWPATTADHPMACSPYVIDYARQFTFPVPPPDVWSAVERCERYEAWWTWLRDFRVEGPGLVTGAVLEGVVAPPLPYRMRVRVVVVACDPPHSIAASVHGDLVGHARLLLEPDGPGTRASAAWNIEMTQRPMRLAARVASPMLRWGHDRVVDVTVAEFRRHLREAD